MPNQDQGNFLSRVLNKLQIIFFRWSLLHQCGFIPTVDVSSGKSSIPHSTLTRIKSLLHFAQLVDVWRVQHSFERDYSCSSVTHNLYSHINYYFVSQSLLDLPIKATLGNILWSDLLLSTYI